jgi:hypothetical protein
MTGSMLRVVGSGRRARSDEAKRHEEAIRKADELLTLAESFERQPEPDNASDGPEGEDSSPQTNTEAESVEPDPDAAVAAAREWLKTAVNRTPTTALTGNISRLLYHRTMFERMFARSAERYPYQTEVEEEFLKADLARLFDDMADTYAYETRLLRVTNPATRRKLEKQLDAARTLREEINQPDPNEVETAPDEHRGSLQEELQRAQAEIRSLSAPKPD